jgi:hypothetical protein
LVQFQSSLLNYSQENSMKHWVASVHGYARWLWLAVVLAALAGSPAYAAVLLVPGGTLLVPGEIAALPARDKNLPNNGAIELDIRFTLATAPNRPFSIDLGAAGTISGHISDRVLLLGDGNFAFETDVFVDSAPAGAGINKVARSNFSGFSTVEVGWEDQDIGTLHTPNSAQRSLITGSDVQFNFTSDPITVPPDTDTAWAAFVIITDPTTIGFGKFRAGALSGTDERLSNLVDVFSPVPEPQAWLTLLIGVAALIGTRRRAAGG